MEFEVDKSLLKMEEYIKKWS